MSKNKDLQDAREKFFDGPASDYQSFYQFLMQQALDDHAKALKEMQEALKQVRENIFGGKRTEKSKGGRVKLAKGSPNPALMDATSNRATNGPISRGGGAAVRGINFKGIF